MVRGTTLLKLTMRGLEAQRLETERLMRRETDPGRKQRLDQRRRELEASIRHTIGALMQAQMFREVEELYDLNCEVTVFDVSIPAVSQLEPGDAMSAAMDHLAERVDTDPAFLGYWSRLWIDGTGRTWADLCERIGLDPAGLTDVRLCGVPRPHSRGVEVEAIATRSGCDQAALDAVLAEVGR